MREVQERLEEMGVPPGQAAWAVYTTHQRVLEGKWRPTVTVRAHHGILLVTCTSAEAKYEVTDLSTFGATPARG